jgi:transposase
MKAYSLDFRKKITDTYFKEELSQRKLAKRFGVALSFVEKLLKQQRETGDLAPKPHGGGRTPKLNAAQLALVAALVEADNDATLEELCEQLQQRTTITLSRSTMGRILQQLKLTRKKKTLHASEKIPHAFNKPVWTIGKRCEISTLRISCLSMNPASIWQ